MPRELTVGRKTREAISKSLRTSQREALTAAAFLCRARHGRKSQEPTCASCLAAITRDVEGIIPDAFYATQRVDGATEGGEAVLCGSVKDGRLYREFGCGRTITMDTGVRCLDCGIRLCDECARKHFTNHLPDREPDDA